MYAIVEISGKQFRVEENMKLKVPSLATEPGKKVNFDKVLLLENDKGDIKIGAPTVAKSVVSATVLEHGRDKKIIVFKKKRRKGYQKKNGHRQGFSLIQITGIAEAAKAAAKKESKSKTGEKAAPKKAAPKASAAEKSAPKKAAPAKKPAVKKAASKATVEKKAAPAKKAAPKTAAAKKGSAAKTAKKKTETKATKTEKKED